jgi:hypothetical protein
MRRWGRSGWIDGFSNNLRRSERGRVAGLEQQLVLAGVAALAEGEGIHALVGAVLLEHRVALQRQGVEVAIPLLLDGDDGDAEGAEGGDEREVHGLPAVQRALQLGGLLAIAILGGSAACDADQADAAALLLGIEQQLIIVLAAQALQQGVHGLTLDQPPVAPGLEQGGAMVPTIDGGVADVEEGVDLAAAEVLIDLGADGKGERSESGGQLGVAGVPVAFLVVHGSARVGRLTAPRR